MPQPTRMHDDEVVTSAAVIRRLLAQQFPLWAGSPIRALRSSGTDNAIYRLGDDLVVRVPRVASAVAQIAKEQEWLPRLAPLLPLEVPIPLAVGQPGAGYPWPWAVYRWLDGKHPSKTVLTDPQQAALDLAQFISALQAADAAGGPVPGTANAHRGEPLANRDDATRAAITALRDEVDAAAVTAAWDAALNASAAHGPPAWLHGDLLPGNLLVRSGRLAAVIDFGCLGVGDPACDLMAAWTLLSAETRALFRRALGAGDDAWVRGRGWALSFALIALPYYRHTNPTLAATARRTIAEVLADAG